MPPDVPFQLTLEDYEQFAERLAGAGVTVHETSRDVRETLSEARSRTETYHGVLTFRGLDFKFERSKREPTLSLSNTSGVDCSLSVDLGNEKQAKDALWALLDIVERAFPQPEVKRAVCPAFERPKPNRGLQVTCCLLMAFFIAAIFLTVFFAVIGVRAFLAGHY